MKCSAIDFDPKYNIYYFMVSGYGIRAIPIKMHLKLMFNVNTYIDWNKGVIIAESSCRDTLVEARLDLIGK